MILRATLPIVLLGASVFAQTPDAAATAAAEAALKARVTEFFTYHVQPVNFRKAMTMVAEDTQDEYFASGKSVLTSFTIDSVKLSDNNTKATVNMTVKRIWQIRLQEQEVIVPMMTTWKIEDGKWVWFHDLTAAAYLTPMVVQSHVDPPGKNPDGTIKLPKNLNADLIAAQAQSIMAQSGIDKGNVEFASSPEEVRDAVTFTNGAQGTIRLSVADVPNLPGLRASLDKFELTAGDKAHLSLSYRRPSDDAPVPEPFTVRIVTEPFNQVFGVRVSFAVPEPK